MRAPSPRSLAAVVALALGCSESAAPYDATAPDAPPDARAADASALDVFIADAPAPDAPLPFDEAARNASLARPLLAHLRRWLTEELTHVDPASGLLVDTYDASTPWSTRDTAADIYPFFSWTAYLLDPDVFTGQSRRMLDFERANTTVAATGALPYSYDTRTGMRFDRGADDLMFGAAEYAKDGLTPIFELAGRGPWSERAQEIERDSFRYGTWMTPAGTLPMNNLEVNGDHMQVLPRLAAMTGDRQYLALAERVAEQYLVLAQYRPQNLRDHSCEIIGGFALLYAVERQLGSPMAARYEPLLRDMIDYIADYGLTPEGMMHNVVHAGTRGPVPAPRGTLSDNWGQNYVAFLMYAQLANQPRYAAYVDHALRSLADPQFHDYPWEGTIIDGLADSMEGAIYMLAYRPVPEGQRWLDNEALVLDSRAWPADKFGANAARTAVLYARTKTLGAWVRPWRDDVSWGAARTANGVVVSVRADRAWSGRVTFDRARHRDTLGFAEDYPRMNYLPEYFIADSASRYRVTTSGGHTETVMGSALLDGYALDVPAGNTVNLVVERLP